MDLAADPLAYSGGSRAWFQRMSLAATLSVFALVILGGVVRITGSGLGCPDWPACHGGIFPPLETKAIIEYSHRIVASFLVAPLIAATCISAWTVYRRERWLVIPSTAGLALVIAQAMLGGATVLTELPGATVMAHLAVGETLLACMVLVTVVAHRGALGSGPQAWAVGKIRRFPTLALVSGVGVFLLLLSGSYLTITGSTGACLHWPLCNSEAFPMHRLQAIHMMHRYVAAIVGLFLLYSLHLGFRGRTQPLEIRVLCIAGAALFVGQVLAGAGAVWTDFSQGFRALHLALATGVWGVVAAVAALSFSRGGRVRG